MKIACMGSGGVGGYFGARLQQGGHDVTFIARGRHLAAMRKDGLTLEKLEWVKELKDVRRGIARVRTLLARQNAGASAPQAKGR
jgi:ketopantoate reductase